MIKFDDILTMGNVGLINATSHSLSVQGAYTLTRLKAEVNRLMKEYASRYNALPQEVEITDTEAFDARKKELASKEKRNKTEQKELEDMNNKLVRLKALRETLLDDQVTINCKPMCYDDWHNLKQENRGLQVPYFDNQGKEIGKCELFELIENISEGILWVAPAE